MYFMQHDRSSRITRLYHKFRDSNDRLASVPSSALLISTTPEMTASGDTARATLPGRSRRHLHK